MSEYLSVPNLKKYQHYKDRSPPWIKLHSKVLDNYKFECLQDASKAHLMLIWLLASRTDNKIKNDARWIARKIGANQEINLKELVDAGFLIENNCVADCLQSASKLLEAEERETEKRESREEDKKPSSSKPDKLNNYDTRLIFDFWKETLNHPKAKFDDKRRMIILKAFKMKFSAEDLKQAVVGCSLTPHNMGKNDNGTVYDGLHVIFKDANQIERFMSNATNPPKEFNNGYKHNNVGRKLTAPELIQQAREKIYGKPGVVLEGIYSEAAGDYEPNMGENGGAVRQ